MILEFNAFTSNFSSLGGQLLPTFDYKLVEELDYTDFMLTT